MGPKVVKGFQVLNRSRHPSLLTNIVSVRLCDKPLGYSNSRIIRKYLTQKILTGKADPTVECKGEIFCRSSFSAFFIANTADLQLARLLTTCFEADWVGVESSS